MEKVIVNDPDTVVYRYKITSPFNTEVVVDAYEIPPYAVDYPVVLTVARKLELEKNGWKFSSNTGDNNGGSSGSGERKSKVLTPESPGVEDQGEGGFWYTFTLEDAEHMISIYGISRVIIPTAKEINFPLHTHITIITDDALFVIRKEFIDENDDSYQSRLFLANGNDGNEHYDIPGTSIATLVLFRKDDDPEDYWMISGPGINVYNGE